MGGGGDDNRVGLGGAADGLGVIQGEQGIAVIGVLLVEKNLRPPGGLGLLRPGPSKPPDIHGCQEDMVLTVQLIALKNSFRPLSTRSGKLPAS